MKKTCSLSLCSALVCLLVSCTGPLMQFYPDIYYEEDRLYENKPLRFLLQFKGNWELICDPDEFGRGILPLAKQASKEGRELLFVGSTVEGRHVVTGMVSNANEPARDYAEIIRRLNRDNVENDQGLTDMVVNRNSMVKWVYDKGNSRIVEFIFQINTYDIRIIFGSPQELFGKFLPVYEEIMASLQVTR